MNPSIAPTVVELEEWKTKTLQGRELTAEDRVMVARLAKDDTQRLVVEELRGSVRISAKSWVGVVRFHNFEVRIVPKLAGGNRRLAEMIERTSGFGSLKRYDKTFDLLSGSDNLLDLIAYMLAEQCERVVRAGLIADYREEEEELPVVRGRMLVERQVRERFGRVDRLLCRFDERQQDVLENQVLAAALDLCARRSRNADVRRRTRYLAEIFAEVCDAQALDFVEARRVITYDRLNQHYRVAHELAWLIFESLGVQDPFSCGATSVFSFLLDMNRLFERFVGEVLRWFAQHIRFRVEYQRSDRSIIQHADTRKSYARVVPDFLIQPLSSPTAPRIALDAKYKLYDDAQVNNADIYQTFLYAYAFGGAGAFESPCAALIYPTCQPQGSSERLLVRRADRTVGATIHLLGLPIGATLDEMRVNRPGAATAELVKALGYTFEVGES